MPTPVFFHSFIEAAMEKKHNLSSDTLKWVLSNTAPVASTNTVLADITQIANGNGYTTGGATWGSVTSTTSSGTYYLNGADVTWTASGGTMATFRYAVLYNDTATNDELICYLDYGVGLSYGTGLTHTIDIDATLGLFNLSVA